MKFIDELNIYVKAGNGGNGCVSFLHSHLNPFSGPDGGNGGKGGNICFKGNDQLNSLYKLSSNKKWFAESGVNGGESLRTGKSGDDLFINVPLGTIIYMISEDKTREFLGEILYNNQVIVTFKGGKGGLGNSAFASSLNRTPRYAQKGEITKELKVFLELRIIADIGFLGLPNSGKSTLLNALTNAQVRTEDFKFTTLSPQLGVLNQSKFETRTIIADLPGIIEGASENKGLGFRFLRHVSRCKILVYVVDSNKEDPFNDLSLLVNELEKSKQTNFKSKEQIIIWNKIDLISTRKLNEIKSKSLKIEKCIFLFISALEGKGISQMVNILDNFKDNFKDFSNDVKSDLKTYKIYDFTQNFVDIEIKRLKKSYWKLSGSCLDKIIAENKSDFSSEIYLVSKILDNFIIRDKLLEAGVKSKDTLLINDEEYIWSYSNK